MRKEILKTVKRLVIKIGSGVLTDVAGALDIAVIERICHEISTLRGSGIEIIIVSSGAIAAGRSELGLMDKPRTIPHKQAAAAVGQTILMQAYQDAFRRHNLKTAQVLLTGEDLGSRQRFLNARATLDALLGFGVIPIINENDTVVVDEIKFGDNDNLSALVTNVAEADMLLIMTDIEGFYTSDPRSNPNAELVHLVKSVTREIERAAGGSASTVGTGGMATKVAAAKKAGKNGVPTIMVSGKRSGIVVAALNGEEVGTMFLPSSKGLNRRKQWIAYTLKPTGKIIVDDGAKVALLKRGKSLLPSGVVSLEGKFERGSSVRLCGLDGVEFARGLSDYSTTEVNRIAGCKSAEIEKILGYHYGDVIVHRDNLVLI